MSLERACVNCERCYRLADGIIEDKISLETKYTGTSSLDKQGKLREDSEFRKGCVYKDGEVYNARNEAMKALEEAQREAIKITEINVLDRRVEDLRTEIQKEALFGPYKSNVYHSTKGPVAQKALEACEPCDYSAPRIVEVINAQREEK